MLIYNSQEFNIQVYKPPLLNIPWILPLNIPVKLLWSAVKSPKIAENFIKNKKLLWDEDFESDSASGTDFECRN